MLYDGLTAEQYLQFVGRARGLGKQVRQVAVDTLLQVVGLDERRWRDVSAFSPGERRRLALASALVHEPDVLLLDDPLRGLDGFARLEQIEVLRELHRLGSTMLMAATRPEDVLEVCDSVAVLRDGTLVWSGDAAAAAALAAPQYARRRPRTRRGHRRARGGGGAARRSGATCRSSRSTRMVATSGSCSQVTRKRWPPCCRN